MTDGSCIAFFDLGDDDACAPSPNTPDWVNHIAFRVDGVAQLEQVKARLEANGVDVVGITDHHIFKSIYFFDPNGIRVELSAQLASEMQMLEESKHAHSRLAEWTRRKNEWRRERAAGGGTSVLKPQQNDRPEVAERAARAGDAPR
jgi:predicted metal-dependent phosphoesterase TrpH